jgi:ketol-acid reductoisomerase
MLQQQEVQAGVLNSSFVAEVKSDLMGSNYSLRDACKLDLFYVLTNDGKKELSLLCPAKLTNTVENSYNTEALKYGGINHYDGRSNLQ